MRTLLVIGCIMCSIVTYAQGKYNYQQYNKVIELQDTEHVIATLEDVGKMSTKSEHLLFINMRDGSSKQSNFPDGSYISHLEQVLVDSLGVNRVLVIASTVNLDGDKKIDYDDPKQVFIFTTDGKQDQVTDNNFFARLWHIDRRVGTMLVLGYIDSNTNGKYDHEDKSQVIVYDLKTMKRLSVI